MQVSICFPKPAVGKLTAAYLNSGIRLLCLVGRLSSTVNGFFLFQGSDESYANDLEASIGVGRGDRGLVVGNGCLCFWPSLAWQQWRQLGIQRWIQRRQLGIERWKLGIQRW